MAQVKFGSPGVSSNEIDISGPVSVAPVGTPAGVIGTANKGPAFVPLTLGSIEDFYAKFGETDGSKFGPIAVNEWLRNAGAVTYVRVLGVGNGKTRNSDGSVTNAGFTVGENQPRFSDGFLFGNTYANSGSNSVLGRTYFLGAFMSESAGSTFFSSAGLQGAAGVVPGTTASVPIVRGIVMAPSGVILKLSSSAEGNNAVPGSDMVATDSVASGGLLGAVVLSENNVSKQDFVMLLNGHKGTDFLYPNVITASFDMTSPNYFAKVMNTDPYKLQQAGHFLYAHWDIHNSVAVVTGTGLLHTTSGSGGSRAAKVGVESSAFLTTGSLSRATGNTTVPNYESWTDRFSYAKTPWVTSQKFGGQAINLFRLHALSAGSGVAQAYKFSIENLVPSSDPLNRYGTFDLVIRDWDDSDTNPIYIEQHRALSLDPSSDRYIAKVIGDVNAFFDFNRAETNQRLIIEGNYENKSNIVRVEVSSLVDNASVDPTALPFGFRGVSHLVTSGSAPLATPSTTQAAVSSVLKKAQTPPVPLRLNITQGSGNKLAANPLLYWGAQFEHIVSLTTPNASTLQNESLSAFSMFFPQHLTDSVTFAVGDNNGVADTAANGILDADRFCLNAFSLENIMVVTASTGVADSSLWMSASYVRDGNIVTNETTKTRKLATTDLTQANRRYAKFTFFLQGGFDGVNIFDRNEYNINDTAVKADMDDSNRGQNLGPNVRSYTKAIDIMKNTTNVDIQVLAIPGIRNPAVTDYATAATTERFDALYLMDVEHCDDNGNIIAADSSTQVSVKKIADNFSSRALDSNFAAAYFPDVTLTDPNTNTNLVVPPSAVVLGALALNDKLGHPWFAPAGFTRGALVSTLEAKVKLSKSNMDDLYDVNINPLVAFPGNSSPTGNPAGGVVIWGQKTLQAAASALDRVNVRRLMIDLRRQVRDIAQTIMFEPSREATLAKFSSAVKPKLDRIQALAGIDKYKIMIDTSTTTKTDIENNTLRGKIIVKPVKALEYVSLDFVVQNGAAQI